MSIANITVAPPPPDSCIPQPIVDWVSTSIQLTQSQIDASQRILQQTTAPGPDDRDAIWNRISGIGAPLGFYIYYNGAWRRYPMSPIPQRSFYAGPITGVFDPITLVGLPGTEWDGWKIDLTFANLFPIIASDYNAGTAVWQTTISGAEQSQGGVTQVLLDPTNIPLPSTPALNTTLWAASGNHPGGESALWGVPEPNFPANTQLIPAQPGNPNPVPFSVIPPYVAMAQVVFIGISV